MIPVIGGSFGEYLVRQRRAAGWSQEELAERSLVSVRTIRNIETGSIKSPRKSSIELLLGAFSSAGLSGRPRFLASAWMGGWTDPPRPEGPTRPPGAARSRWLGTPAEPEPIVGRSADFGQIAERVRQERHIVLTGPGGIGKTRLALAAADRMRAVYRDGVAIVGAGALPPEGADPAEDVERMRRAVLAAVNPADRSERGTLPHDSRMLLVIDNAEHVSKATALLAQQLLDAWSGLHLIITSRRPMATPSAPVWEVGPLSLDGGEQSEAVQFFLRRVRLACPTLDLTGRLDAVQALCEQLDGVPLALELTALRLRWVALDTLLRDGPITQMLGQPRLAELPHHRTLANSVRWSYDLLTEKQRGLLHLLAAFPGTFTIEDVERLYGRSGAHGTDVMGQFAELVDSSLVLVERRLRYSYRLLGYVREFVLGRTGGASLWRAGHRAVADKPARRDPNMQCAALA